ncbi:hypothetical protein [Pseudomonas entomophila]|uniref:hypothetical protein n=1 Tax=Pseudomonas entomophila TaxID=312306 RepID=UPI003EBB4005
MKLAIAKLETFAGRQVAHLDLASGKPCQKLNAYDDWKTINPYLYDFNGIFLENSIPTMVLGNP